MHFLVLDASDKIRESLCYVLLSFGIKAMPVVNRRAAVEALAADADIDGAIIDIDNQEAEGRELVNELRGSPETQGIKIIVHTIQSHKEFVVRLVELGVLGYLLKPYDEAEIFPRLKNILAKLESHDSQRRHIRVQPDPEELLRVHFRLPGHKNLISGKILDISVGGMALDLINPPPPAQLSPGSRIPEIRFTISTRQYAVPAAVILNKATFLALRFEALADGEKAHLARYIFKRIST
jgi:two-component system OmpR family response regulator